MNLPIYNCCCKTNKPNKVKTKQPFKLKNKNENNKISAWNVFITNLPWKFLSQTLSTYTKQQSRNHRGETLLHTIPTNTLTHSTKELLKSIKLLEANDCTAKNSPWVLLMLVYKSICCWLFSGQSVLSKRMSALVVESIAQDCGAERNPS